jgi:hypothetical protein
VATRAIEIGTLTCGSVRSILDNKLDRRWRNRARPIPPRSSTPTSGAPATTIELVRRMNMLTHPIRDQLAQLGLAGMAEAFADSKPPARVPA